MKRLILSICSLLFVFSVAFATTESESSESVKNACANNKENSKECMDAKNTQNVNAAQELSDF